VGIHCDSRPPRRLLHGIHRRPIVGGLFGAGIYQAVVRRYLPRAMGEELTEMGRPEEVSASV